MYTGIAFYNSDYIGIQVDSPRISSTQTLKAFTICASFDLPARASALNVMQYNGLYGCTFCEQPGSTLRTEKGGNVHVFLYDVETPKGPPIRTHDSQMKHARKAVEQSTVVCICVVNKDSNCI